MSNKGILNTVSKTMVLAMQYLPHILQDTISQIHYFYQNSSPVSKRWLGPTMKALGELGIEIYQSHSDILSKDLNPTSSAINREMTSMIQNVINTKNGALHMSNRPEIQEEFFFAGQTLRVACKLMIQSANEALKTSNMTTDDYVIASRNSNIVCELFSVGGTALSKKIYPLTVNNQDINKLDFFRQQMNLEFFREIGLVTLEKTMILDSLGEVIKGIRGSSFMTQINYYDDLKKSALTTCFNVSTTSLDFNTPITAQWHNTFEETGNSLKGYIINTALFISKASDKVLLDLFVYGPILLSTANAVTGGYGKATNLVLPIIQEFSPLSGYQQFQTEFTIVSATAASYFFFQTVKEPLFQHVTNIAPELMSIGTLFLSSNYAYDLFRDSSVLTKLSFTSAALVYSHYKEDFISYLSLFGENFFNQDALQ